MVSPLAYIHPEAMEIRSFRVLSSEQFHKTSSFVEKNQLLRSETII